MKLPNSYVLVLEHQSEDVHHLHTALKQLRCPMVVVRSVEQAIATAHEKPPYLVILTGNYQAWPYHLISDLRGLTRHCGMTIVALSDGGASWLPQEDNPGLDGFLVNPIKGDVLISLIQSAWARQICCSAMTG